MDTPSGQLARAKIAAIAATATTEGACTEVLATSTVLTGNKPRLPAITIIHIIVGGQSTLTAATVFTVRSVRCWQIEFEFMSKPVSQTSHQSCRVE
jgi:hypothetical protein